MTESLIALADNNPDHLDAFVRSNPAVFLNPKSVGGDVRAPLARQFSYYLRNAQPLDAEHMKDIECALRTGVVKGLARGDAGSDDDEVDEDWRSLPADWREEPFDAWAAQLRCETSRTGGCLITPDGSHCVGPLPLQEWLECCLPQAINRLRHALALTLPPGSGVTPCTPNKDGQDRAACARDAAIRLCGILTRAVEAELLALRVSESGSNITSHLRTLLLTVHCMGEVGASEQWLIHDARDAALGCAHAAVSRLADVGCHAPVQPTGVPHVSLWTELSCIAFLASLVAQQEAQAHRSEAQLAKELQLSEACLDDGWSGDDEDRSAHALMYLAVGLAEHGRSAT